MERSARRCPRAHTPLDGTQTGRVHRPSLRCFTMLQRTSHRQAVGSTQSTLRLPPSRGLVWNSQLYEWNLSVLESPDRVRGARLVWTDTKSTFQCRGCVTWGGTREANIAPQAVVDLAGSCMDASWGSTVPLLASPFASLSSKGNDLRLAPLSPCRDLLSPTDLPPDWLDVDGDGDLTEALPLDVDGQPRSLGVAVDAGAYEDAP